MAMAIIVVICTSRFNIVLFFAARGNLIRSSGARHIFSKLFDMQIALHFFVGDSLKEGLVNFHRLHAFHVQPV